MLDYIQKLLADNAGDPSSMRVMSFVAILAGVIVGVLGVSLDRDLTGLSLLVGAFLVPAFGGKVMQSKNENAKEGS